MTIEPQVLATVIVPPAVKGMAGAYRVYTYASGLPFGALPPWLDGGPGRVSVGSWCVSTSSWCAALSTPGTGPDGPPVTLNATRRVAGVLERHPLDGTGFDAVAEADRAAYNAELIGYMVYDHEAAGYGLPTG